MAEMNFFNYAQSAQDAEMINSSRLKNRAAGIAISEDENFIKNRTEARRIRMEFEETPAQIEAMENQGLFQEAGELRKTYMEQRFGEVEQLERIRPSLNKDNWKQFRQDMIQSGAVESSTLPVEYSDKWLQDEIKTKLGDVKKITQQYTDENERVMSQDTLYQDGRPINQGTPYESSQNKNSRTGATGGGKPFMMKPSDSNSIRGATASLFGGDWDPATGKFAGLNRTQSQEVAAVADEASRIYNENKGQVPHDRAVTMAARKLGIEIQDLQNDPNNLDPVGLF